MRVPMPLLVVGCVAALPVLIPWVVADHFLRERRLRAACRRSPCQSCGRSLGVEARGEANRRWKAHVAGLRRRHPHVKLRLSRPLDAVCPGCGALLAFREGVGFTPSGPGL